MGPRGFEMAPVDSGRFAGSPRGIVTTELDLKALDREFDDASAETIVEWVDETFPGRWCVTTSLTDAVLIDVVASVVEKPTVVFIDTGFHFPETFQMLTAVEERYGIVIDRVRPDLPRLEGMYREDPDGCCTRHKVAPFESALSSYDAWVSGLRRADSELRSTARIVSRDRRELVKVNPLANWSDQQVVDRIREQRLPTHPLFHRGYGSIGCAPCTLPGSMSGREGRWVHHAKTECGLHL